MNMTSISNDPTTPSLTTGPDITALAGDGAANLTPDALMAYCQSRLDSIDGQVQSTFNSEQLRNGETAALQQVITTFQKYIGGVAAGDAKGASKCAEMENALSGLIQRFKTSDPNSPELGKLEQTYNDLLFTGSGGQPPLNGPMPAGTPPPSSLSYMDPGTYPPNQSGPEGDKVIDGGEMQGFVQSLQGCASDLTSGSQLQMIQLESLMSQRQTAVELTTNLVQSLGSQSEKIAENIGH